MIQQRQPNSNMSFAKEMRAGRLAAAWVASALIILTFDILWCSLTTFRSLSFAPTWLFAIFGATTVALPAALAPRRPWIQLTVWLILIGVMTANMMYYRTYFTAIPAASYAMAGNLADFKGSVTDSLAWTDIILPLEAIAGWVWMRRRRCVASRPVRLCAAAFGVTGVLAFVSSIPYGGPAAHIRRLSQECYYANCPPVIYTIAAPPVVELLEAAEPLTESQRLELENWLAEHERLSGMPDSTSAAGAGRSLVYIFLESLETWPVGLEIEGQRVTPFIDSLIADSVTTYIPNLVTQVGAGRSIDAQLLLLAGLLPMERDVAAMSRPDNVYYTIPKAMKETAPTRSYLLTGDKASVWNQARVARSFGIDTLLDASSWEMTEKIGNPPKLADGALFSQIVDRMRSGEIMPEGERAYVQIVGYSGHNPWRIPEERRRLHLTGSYPDKFADYLTAMNYVDGALEPLVGYLRSRADADSITIVITGDHEGLASYRSAMTADEVTGGIVDPAEHTPLIVVNSPRPGVLAAEAGQVDAYATLLDIMGLGGYEWRGMGVSLLSGAHSGEAVGRDGTGSADPHLLAARHVSDLIIRHNMLAGDKMAGK